jgi:hypothetical protein
LPTFKETMDDTNVPRKGLLLAMMEPPGNLEEEFQDWYDSEHFPERANCEGFETAHRFVCIDGFPRYLAVYDLANVDVLKGAGYAAIALGRYSPWTHRIMAKVWGQYRAEGVQLHPGNALLGDRGVCSRLVVVRLRQVPEATLASLVATVSRACEDASTYAQARVFRVPGPPPADALALVEVRMPDARLGVTAFGPFAQHVDLVNTYVRYARQAPGAFPKTS